MDRKSNVERGDLSGEENEMIFLPSTKFSSLKVLPDWLPHIWPSGEWRRGRRFSVCDEAATCRRRRRRRDGGREAASTSVVKWESSAHGGATAADNFASHRHRQRSGKKQEIDSYTYIPVSFNHSGLFWSDNVLGKNKKWLQPDRVINDDHIRPVPAFER